VIKSEPMERRHPVVAGPETAGNGRWKMLLVTARGSSFNLSLFWFYFFLKKKGTKGKRASREQPTILTLWLRQMMTLGVERLAVRSATRD